jgi:hypothetical protein
MSGAISEFETELLPELGASHEHHEASYESEQFFGALANLARRGAGWISTPGSPQRQLALSAARQALTRGASALGGWAASRYLGPEDAAAGRALGAQTGRWIGGLLPQREYESEFEFELNPARKIYPDAMLEHLGHAAAETESEAEAEALAGAMVPLAARIMPRAAPVLTRATPGLVCAVSGVTQRLRRDPATRPLVRTLPAIVRVTAAALSQQAARGVPITPQAAVNMLARQTLRVLGSPQRSATAFRRSQALDRHYHRTVVPGSPLAPRPFSFAVCPRCGGPVT